MMGPLTLRGTAHLVMVGLLLMTLSCGSSKSVDTQPADMQPVPEPVAPQLATFTATPNTVDQGVTTEVRWQWTYATPPWPEPTCVLNNGVGPVHNSMTTATRLTSATEFELTCTNQAGSGSATTLVQVKPQLPPGESFVQLSAGFANTCGVTVDRRLTCWGSNSWGMSEPPTGEYLAVSPGWYHVCAIAADQTVRCWGTLPEAPAGTFTAVSAGQDYTCGLKTDSTLTCWGNEAVFYDKLGAPSGSFKALSVGSNHACALKQDQTIACWGNNDEGQSSPPAGQFLAVSAGDDHSCAIDHERAVVCWGRSLTGSSETDPEHRYLDVSSGAGYTCGLKESGAVACWGAELGNTFLLYDDYDSVTGGQNHACGLRRDGSAVCWGNDFGGKATVPTGVFQSLAIGAARLCALSDDGVVECWGAAPQWWAKKEPSGSFISIYGNYLNEHDNIGYFCAMAADQLVTCWGHDGQAEDWLPEEPLARFSLGIRNSAGIRNDGSLMYRGWAAYDENGEPTLLPEGPFIDVSLYRSHGCAIRLDGTLICWESLGPDYLYDVPGVPAGRFTAVSMGKWHGCGILEDQSVHCWMLPDVPEHHHTGQATPPPGAFIAVSASATYFACGIKADRTLACWGKDKGTVPSGTFTAVSVNDNFSCALSDKGVQVCWGGAARGWWSTPGT